MIQPSTLPGMMELLPEDQLVFDTIKRKIEDVFIKNAFFSIDTPAIEKLDVLLSKGGGETSKQVFRIDNSKKNQRFSVPIQKISNSKSLQGREKSKGSLQRILSM